MVLILKNFKICRHSLPNCRIYSLPRSLSAGVHIAGKQYILISIFHTKQQAIGSQYQLLLRGGF